ncbi:siderophore-interacting protein [Jatrophihabitans sp. YIM 134969]
MADAGRRREARPPAELQVLDRIQLNPHMVRIVAGGNGYAQYNDNDFTDKYVKIFFADTDGQQVTRTYTVRRSDPVNQQLTLDFVVHGDLGLAAPWARAAEAGETLRLRGAGGAYRPSEEHGTHVFLGDESALPAINAALDALPRDARGVALLEVSEVEGSLDAEVPSGIEIVWLERPEPGSQPGLLADALAARPWPTGGVDVFAHGERESMKAVRKVLRDLTTDADQVSISGYWAYGRTEDRFQAEKREPIGNIDG